MTSYTLYPQLSPFRHIIGTTMLNVCGDRPLGRFFCRSTSPAAIICHRRLSGQARSSPLITNEPHSEHTYAELVIVAYELAKQYFPLESLIVHTAWKPCFIIMGFAGAGPGGGKNLTRDSKACKRALKQGEEQRAGIAMIAVCLSIPCKEASVLMT